MKKFIYTFIAVIFVSTITTGTAQAASHSCPYVADANTYVVKFTPTVLFSNQSPYWTPFTYTNVPAGEYDITMYSYDNHSGHGGQNQTLETWRVGFYTNSHVPEVSSPESKDVPENSDTSVITHRDVKVPAGTKKMLAYHAHRGAGNYQSVVPICVKLEKKTTPLTGSCTVSDTSVKKGDTVTFTANAGGGDGSYTYKWNGSVSGTNRIAHETFTSEGSYSSSVTIKDGSGKSKTVNCKSVVIDKIIPPTPKPPVNNLNVSCDTSDSRIEEGDSVRFSADTTGANGSVTYTWSGDVTGNSSSVTDRFNREGTYRGTVTATDSTGNTDSATCSVRVEEEEEDEDDLEVTCEVSDHRVEEGDTVTFTADVDGGAGSVDYDWRGDIDGDDRREKVRFNRDGEYEVTIRVEDRDGNRATDECRVVRVSDSGNVLGASIVASTPPQGEFAAVESVFLSQVPYTGPAETATMIALTTGLLAWAFFLVRFFMKRRNIQLQANRMEAFKAMNRG